MLALFAAAVLGAAYPLPDSTVVLHLEKTTGSQGVIDFLRAASRRSRLLDPENWRADPVLRLDFSDLAAIESVGFDPAGSYTRSIRGGSDAACLQVKDRKKLEAAVTEHLANLREGNKVVRRKSATAQLFTASDEEGAVYGLVVRGKLACTAVDRDGDAGTFEELARALARPASGDFKRLGEAPGSAHLVTAHTLVGLNGTSEQLVAEGTSRLASLPRVLADGESPYAKEGTGILYARAFVEPKDRRRWLGRIFRRIDDFCPRCEVDADALAQLVDKNASGHMLFRLHDVEVKGSLRTRIGQFMALRQVVLIDLDRTEPIARRLLQIPKTAKLQHTTNQVTLSLPEGEITVGLRGRQLYLTNDPEALEATLPLASGDFNPLAHGLELTADGPGLRRALGKISPLEALSAPDLAALFAASTELGPLLGSTRKLTGWVDSSPSGGAHRFRMEWALE